MRQNTAKDVVALPHRSIQSETNGRTTRDRENRGRERSPEEHTSHKMQRFSIVSIEPPDRGNHRHQKKRGQAKSGEQGGNLERAHGVSRSRPSTGCW